jgi:hypothetical protein
MERLNAPPVTLAPFRGNVVALAFILTTCPHCRQARRIGRMLPYTTGFRGTR